MLLPGELWTLQEFGLISEIKYKHKNTENGELVYCHKNFSQNQAENILIPPHNSLSVVIQNS